MSRVEVVDWSPQWAEARPGTDIDTYIAGKSAVLQQVLETSGDFSDDELAAIRRRNDADA